MRDIKFRAWKKTDTQEMFTNITVIDFKKNIIGIDFPISTQTVRADVESLDNIVLMQCTGKKDINGIEIYDGDIVNNGQHTYRVHFGEFTDSDDFQYPATRQTGFYIVDTHTYETFPFYSLVYRVIGNIHENKDLLED